MIVPCPALLRHDRFKGRISVGATSSVARGVQLFLVEPGKLNQNAYIESFNGRFRYEAYINTGSPAYPMRSSSPKPDGGNTTMNGTQNSAAV